MCVGNPTPNPAAVQTQGRTPSAGQGITSRGGRKITPSPMFVDEQPGLMMLSESMRKNALAQHRDNKGILFAHLQALAIQVNGGDPDYIKDSLVTIFCEVASIPTSMISNTLDRGAREIMEVRKADPISLFACVSCGDTLPDPPHRRDLLRQVRALNRIVRTDAGEAVEADAFYALICRACENGHRDQRAEQLQTDRLVLQARKRELSRMPFSEYQRTQEWKIKRSRALVRAGNKCQLCSSVEKPLNAHHNTYERYGDELLKDLTVLCRACHKRYHGIPFKAA